MINEIISIRNKIIIEIFAYYFVGIKKFKF